MIGRSEKNWEFPHYFSLAVSLAMKRRIYDVRENVIAIASSAWRRVAYRYAKNRLSQSTRAEFRERR
jgi:hypothetical protein